MKIMITAVQQQWLTDYLGVIIRDARGYWGLNKQCPKEIMFQSGNLTWFEFLLDEEIPYSNHYKAIIANISKDIMAMMIEEHIFVDYTDIDEEDNPKNGRIILPKGTKILNIRVPFPPIPYGETKENLDKLLRNTEVIRWMEKNLNECTHNHYELRLNCLSTESALVMSDLYYKFRADN